MKADRIATLLPAVFRSAWPDDDVLAAILDVMEMLHAPVESVLERFDLLFDPYRTRDRLVFELARWVDLDRIYADEQSGAVDSRMQDEIELGRLRELVARSFRLSQLRGTSAGLAMFLEIATGSHGFTIEEPRNVDEAFHLRVHVPAGAAGKIRLIERIVNSEKPAYTTFETVISSS